jgi:hypothetical protein
MVSDNICTVSSVSQNVNPSANLVYIFSIVLKLYMLN